MVLKGYRRLILKLPGGDGDAVYLQPGRGKPGQPQRPRGMIYCSNLCTEIAQNMAAIETVSTEIRGGNGDTVVVTTTKAGEFVVCNLASLCLGNIDVRRGGGGGDHRQRGAGPGQCDRPEFFPLPYAKITNRRYRSIGLGVSGYHHMLAKNGIAWESEEHLRFADEVFERINFAAVEASSDLAAEKGSYDILRAATGKPALTLTSGVMTGENGTDCAGRWPPGNAKRLPGGGGAHQQHQHTLGTTAVWTR